MKLLSSQYCTSAVPHHSVKTVSGFIICRAGAVVLNWATHCTSGEHSNIISFARLHVRDVHIHTCVRTCVYICEAALGEQECV